MACACKVNKDLAYLHKHYGNKTNVTEKEIKEFRIKEFFKQLISFIILMILLPFMFIQILFTFFTKDKTIKIKKNKWLIPIKV